jgi:hypothetical protein
VTITATYNGISKAATLVVNPLSISSLTLSPASVTGGGSTPWNRVTLNAPAPAGGVVVALTADNPAVTLPPSVTIAAGSTTSPQFAIATTAVPVQTAVTITATYNGTGRQASLLVNPPPSR